MAKTRKKLTKPFMDAKKGFIGNILGFTTGVSKEYGDFDIAVVKEENGEEAQMVVDGGLRGALKMSKIATGEAGSLTLAVATDRTFEIEYKGTKDIGKGNEVNVYEIYELT